MVGGVAVDGGSSLSRAAEGGQVGRHVRAVQREWASSVRTCFARFACTPSSRTVGSVAASFVLLRGRFLWSSGSSVELGTVGGAWEEVLSARAALGGRAEEGLCSRIQPPGIMRRFRDPGGISSGVAFVGLVVGGGLVG